MMIKIFGGEIHIHRGRDTWLTPEDQLKINEIYRLSINTIRKIDDTLSAPGGTRKPAGDLKVMATIDEALESVRASTTRTDSLIAYVGTLKDQLDEALANVTIPPDVQAKIDEIFDLETADAAKADEALNANTPPPEPEAQQTRKR